MHFECENPMVDVGLGGGFSQVRRGGRDDHFLHFFPLYSFGGCLWVCACVCVAEGDGGVGAVAAVAVS